MKPLLALPLVLALGSAPSALTLEGAVAVKAEQSFGCGVIMSWGFIDFTHKDETIRVYQMCAMDEEQPRPGARCTISFHPGTIAEMTPDRRQTPFTGNILDAMRCDPPAEAAHHDYRGATITGYGPLPARNGDSAVWPRSVRVTTAEGEPRELYVIHGLWNGKGVPMAYFANDYRPYPAIGATCDFYTSASQRYRGAVRAPGPAELIYRIDC